MAELHAYAHEVSAYIYVYIYIDDQHYARPMHGLIKIHMSIVFLLIYLKLDIRIDNKNK